MRATGPAVVTRASHGIIVGDLLVVHVRDMHIADVIDRAVIKEMSAPPITAFEASTAVTVAIVDTAVEPNGLAPVPRIPDEIATIGGPIPWCP
jgi:hypothetical protein